MHIYPMHLAYFDCSEVHLSRFMQQCHDLLAGSTSLVGQDSIEEEQVGLLANGRLNLRERELLSQSMVFGQNLKTLTLANNDARQ